MNEGYINGCIEQIKGYKKKVKFCKLKKRNL